MASLLTIFSKIESLKGGFPKDAILFYDSFSTSESAPLTSPHTADIGTAVIVDTGNHLAISGGAAVIDGGVTQFLDPRYNPDLAVTRLAGMILMVKLEDSLNNYRHWVGGLYENPDASIFQNRESIITTVSPAGYAIYSTGYAITVAGREAGMKPFVILLRNEGAYFYIKFAAGWQLVWVDHVDVTQTLYLSVRNGDTNRTFSMDDVKIASLVTSYPTQKWAVGLDLCVPGTGSGTSSIAAPTNNDTWSCTARYKFELDITTFNTVAGIDSFYLKYIDADNFLKLDLRDVPQYRVQQKVGGGSTTTVGYANAGADGDHVEVVIDGTSIRVYRNDVIIINGTIDSTVSAAAAGYFDDNGNAVYANLKVRTLDKLGGQCTDILPGPLSNGDTFSHATAGMIEFTVDTLPSSASDQIYFRNGIWRIGITSAGTLALTLAPSSVKILTSGVLSGGERIRIWFDTVGNYRLYYDNSLAGTYYDAALNGVSETAGSAVIANGAIFKDLVAFDVTPSDDLATAITALENI